MITQIGGSVARKLKGEMQTAFTDENIDYTVGLQVVDPFQGYVYENEEYFPEPQAVPFETQFFPDELAAGKWKKQKKWATKRDVKDVADSVSNLHTKREAIEWRAGLKVTDPLQLYVYNDKEYFPRVDVVPFVTDISFDSSKWDLSRLVTKNNIGNIVYVNAIGIGGIVDDTQAFLDALSHATALQYVKRGVKIVARSPVNYYQISQPLKLDELWNITIEFEVTNTFNRQGLNPVPAEEGGNLHWIGADNSSVIDFGAYNFSSTLKNVQINSRGKRVVQYDMSRATVCRDLYLDNCGGRNGDFGAVIGEAIAASDISLCWTNPRFNNMTSCGVLNNSANNYVTFIGGGLSMCGYAPTTDNAFIPNSDNQGYQLHQRGGSLSWLNITLDATPDKLPASGRNVLHASGRMELSGWDDTPGVVSIRTIGGSETLSLASWKHYDGSMTKSNPPERDKLYTPTSIEHSGNWIMTLGSGVDLYGDVHVLGGNQSAVNDTGLHLRVDSKIVGAGVNDGGLVRVTKSGVGELVVSVGGDIIDLPNSHKPTTSNYCRTNGALSASKTRGSESNITTTSYLDAGGNKTSYQNAHLAKDGTERSILAGKCVKVYRSISGGVKISTYTATQSNEVISWGVADFEVKKGANNNGSFEVSIQDISVGFDKPTYGQIKRGSVVLNRSAVSGQPYLQVCVTGGSPATAIYKATGILS